MHNWWNQWATEIARILAEWWLQSKSDHPEQRAKETGDRLSVDSVIPQVAPNSTKDECSTDR